MSVTPKASRDLSVAATYFDGDYLTFPDGATTSNVAISAAVHPGSVTFTNATSTYTISGAALSGTTSVVKNGAGTVILANTNSYTGATTLSGGTLGFQANSGNTSGGVSSALSSSSAVTMASGSAAVFLNGVQISPVATAQFYVGDTDDIGISDAWQIEYFGSIGINPNALSPGGSGLTNLQAYLYGYNPTLYSTNGDGLSDLVNHLMGYAATNTDINGYGLTNAQQLALGLDPFDTGINPAQPTPPSGTPGDEVPPTITLTSPQGATREHRPLVDPCVPMIPKIKATSRSITRILAANPLGTLQNSSGGENNDNRKRRIPENEII